MFTRQKSPPAAKASKKKQPKPAATSAPRELLLLPAGVVVLALLAALLAYFVWSSGTQEGKLSYDSGRHVTVDIVSGKVTGNLLPPPTPIPASLIPKAAAPQETVEQTSAPGIALPDEDVKLRPVPNMALIEKKDERMLPKKSADGVEPWEYYSRSYTAITGIKPVGIIVTGIGINNDLSLAAAKLPAAISFSVSPYAQNPSVWIKSLRVQGHECFMEMPLQSSNYPLTDPGPRALQPSIMPEENMERLEWLLGSGIGYLGFVVPADEVFFSAPKDFIEPVVKEISQRGLALIFSQSKERPALTEILKEEELVYTSSHVFIRYGADATDMKQQFEAAEAIAEQSGQVLLVIEASPVAIQEIEKWTEKLRARGYQLVPASALARMQNS